MTCSDAENNCPLIEGRVKFFLQYEDPKKYDKTKIEKTGYKKLLKKLLKMNCLYHQLAPERV